MAEIQRLCKGRVDIAVFAHEMVMWFRHSHTDSFQLSCSYKLQFIILLISIPASCDCSRMRELSMLDCHRSDLAGQGSIEECIHIVCADNEFSQQQLDLLWRLAPDYPNSLKQVSGTLTVICSWVYGEPLTLLNTVNRVHCTLKYLK